MADNSNYSVSPTRAAMTTENIWRMVNPPVGNGYPDPVRMSFLMWLAAEDREWQSQVKTYRDYYEGEHLYQLTERMREFLELDPNVKFDLNYLPIAVDTLRERLKVVGFEAGDLGGLFDDQEPGIFSQWWNANRMDALQDDVHHAALRDRDAYVLVEWDNETGQPRFSIEEEFDGAYGMVVRYDESNGRQLKFAVKRWPVESGPGAGQLARMNIYTPDAVYKFVSGSGGWVEYVEREGDPWPLLWAGKDGRPLGVTVAHFDNRKSELNDLIPVQDALNKAVIDEIAGADTEGFQMITLSGGAEPDDMEIGPRRILYAPQGTWGSIGAGDLAALSVIVDKYVMRMAQISRTPLSYFQVTGQVSASESQKAYDAPLISKVTNRATRFGNAWEDVMTYARRLHNAFAPGPPLDEGTPISCVWDSFERIDAASTDKTEAETRKLRADIFVALVGQGIANLTAARAAGYDEEMAQALAAGGSGRLLIPDAPDAL